MGEATIYRRQEQHRDRWSSYGAADGIRHLSERLSAEELKEYSIFEGFKDRFLETISPDVSVALWREGAVLFEEGSYIDVAFFLISGSAAAYLAKHANLLTSKWVEVSEPAQLARCLQPICHRVTTID